MPAAIAFDYARAVDRATQLFWKRGYSNASLRELLRVMGIGEGSFYNTFGSKRRLYLACLQHYNDTVSRRRLDALQSPASVRVGVRAFFKTVLDELDDPKTPSVCLLAGSLSVDVLRERELARMVLSDMQEFSAAFQDRLEAAKRAGELPKRFDAAVAAHVLVTFLQGLFRVIRTLHDRTEVERQIDLLLAGLGL
ncbi:MAG TPA: TetR/AcrR family transcriptional regulator [Vicinamibacterales bacterium]|nr:TetR/AcrR family transcriptional regulator [Vicinamibacterales bacterium]